ncbi:cupin domain-containing protein, partial [bacterium]|nr:cupin domain-containing protein [bacterium]
VRNPIGTKHKPKIGAEGATILVKLNQFDQDDVIQKSINTLDKTWLPGSIQGLQVMPLHQYNSENVALVKWDPNTVFVPHKHLGGEEIFVLEGTFYDEHGVYPKGTWIRSPNMSKHHPFTKEEGTTILVKTGHLG